MSYGEGDTIDWITVERVDQWLDNGVGQDYKDQPLAQDWGRVSKISEELGEVIAELILATKQNPRKPFDPEAHNRMLKELGDVVLTGIVAIQHFTKDSYESKTIIRLAFAKVASRVPVNYQALF